MLTFQYSESTYHYILYLKVSNWNIWIMIIIIIIIIGNGLLLLLDDKKIKRKLHSLRGPSSNSKLRRYNKNDHGGYNTQIQPSVITSSGPWVVGIGGVLEDI